MENLPSRIRTLRLLQKRTLKDVADICGFTVSLLSKIESGKTTPPLATLARIASALGISLSDLLESGKQTATVLTTAQKLKETPPAHTDKGYDFHVIAPERSRKVMQPFVFTANKDTAKPGAMRHSGEEYVYVLEGRMRYRVGETTYTLGPGDSLYFDAEEEHDLEPITPTVRYLGIFTERPFDK